MEYKDINDYELIFLVKENNEDAHDLLYSKYSNLVNKYAYEYYSKNKNIGIDIEDLKQEGFYGISLAIKDYDQDKTLFYTYALLCIRREMERLIKYQKRNKQLILTNSLSINSCIDSENNLFYEDVISSGEDILEDIIFDDMFNKVHTFKHNMTFIESQIYELKLNKFGNKEIAELLDLPYKKVDNYLRKIKGLLYSFKLTL